MRSIVKHYGPGPHESGTPQSVHGKRTLYHFTDNPQLLVEGFVEGKGNPFLRGAVSTLNDYEVPRFAEMFPDRELIEMEVVGEILDATGSTGRTPIQILNGYGPSDEFNEILLAASKEVGGPLEPPFFTSVAVTIHADGSATRNREETERFRDSIHRQLAERGYVGYDLGAETVITDINAITYPINPMPVDLIVDLFKSGNARSITKAKDPAFPHGPSIKWPAVYQALRREGHDKSSAAAISNAHWNKYRRWGRAGAPGPKSAAEYEATRGRKARRRKGIPLPESRRKDKVEKIAVPNKLISPAGQPIDPELLDLLRLLG